MPNVLTTDTGHGSTSLGGLSLASGAQSTALGIGSKATGAVSTAIGAQASASGVAATAVGIGATAGGENAIALGNNASANTFHATAIGENATVTANNGVALGSGSVANRDLGIYGYMPTGISFADFTAIQASWSNAAAVSVGLDAAGGGNIKRQIINVAAGSEASDAVNVSQLVALEHIVGANKALQDITGQSAATIFGGGATFNPVTGSISSPTYNVAGGARHDVGSALTAIDGRINSLILTSGVGILYDDPSHTLLTLNPGFAATTVTNVNAGAISATSTDAVNGSQLFAVSQVATQADQKAQSALDEIDVVSGDLAALTQVAVTYDNSSRSSVTFNPGGSAIALSNVGAGAVTAASNDAVNGSQLYTTNARVAAAEADIRALSGRVDGLASDTNRRFDLVHARINGVESDLRQLRKDSNAGIAAAVAISQIPQAVRPNGFLLGMGTGWRDGEMAFAFGASYRAKDDRTSFKASLGYDSSNVTLGFGTGIEF